jgi:nitric oxide reductase subunit B
MPTEAEEKPLSPWWRHVALIVMAVGFSLLTLVTVLTYTNAPPIPTRVTDPSGAVLFTGEDVDMAGVLKHGLWSTAFLNGAYSGPTTLRSICTGR